MTNDNVIKIVFNANKREEDEKDIHALALVEAVIFSFFKDPPDSSFQLGYLFCAVDLLIDMGGEDYTEFAMSCAKDMEE